MTSTTGGSAASRPHTRSPWRDAFEIAMSRPAREPDSGRMDVRFKQNAKQDWLVEELDVPQREGESDRDYLERVASVKEIVQEMVGLYAPTNGSE
jgi:hypothetical protein